MRTIIAILALLVAPVLIGCDDKGQPEPVPKGEPIESPSDPDTGY